MIKNQKAVRKPYIDDVLVVNKNAKGYELYKEEEQKKEENKEPVKVVAKKKGGSNGKIALFGNVYELSDVIKLAVIAGVSLLVVIAGIVVLIVVMVKRKKKKAFNS